MRRDPVLKKEESTMLSFVKISLALALGLALVMPSPAAEDAPATKSPAARGTPNATAQTDSQLAGCLVIDNEGEVAIGKFAKEKSQNKEVQDFAQMLIDDHGKFLDKLAKFNPAGTRRAAARDAAPGAAGARPAASGLDFLALKRQIADQCQATLEKELGQKEGPEFDQCFLFQQAMAHTHMLDVLTVFQKHATPEFASVLADASKTTAHHLAEAKELAKKFEGSPKTARR